MTRYLPPVLWNQLESGTHWAGPKTCLVRRQSDDSSRPVASSLDADRRRLPADFQDSHEDATPKMPVSSPAPPTSTSLPAAFRFRQHQSLCWLAKDVLHSRSKRPQPESDSPTILIVAPVRADQPVHCRPDLRSPHPEPQSTNPCQILRSDRLLQNRFGR